VVTLPLAAIVEPPGERRIRNVHADAELDALVESLRAHGLLHPVGARPLADGRFELVYGARRVAAARRLGWQAIQTSLLLDLADEPALTAALAENLHRKDLAPHELVAALRLLARLHQPGTQLGGFSTGGHAAIQPPPRQPGSAGDLSRRLGVDVSTVARLAALGRDEQLLGKVESGELGLTTASHVARLPGPMRHQMLEQIDQEQLSSRVVHTRVNALLRERPGVVEVVVPVSNMAPQLGAAMHRLRVALGLLANIERLETGQEHQVLEQISEHVQRLQSQAGAVLAYA
jgi:ParB family chromosome partitioning protein